jgi:hypothetical protein
MLKKKYLLSVFFAFTCLGSDGWVHVPRQEKIVQEIEGEDRSIWVVYAKTFDQERLLIRFPEPPVTSHWDGRFTATASHLGVGELKLIVHKREYPPSRSETKISYCSYRDADTGVLVREKRIETEHYSYLLRFTHPLESTKLFSAFAESFELERECDFKRA